MCKKCLVFLLLISRTAINQSLLVYLDHERITFDIANYSQVFIYTGWWLVVEFRMCVPSYTGIVSGMHLPFAWNPNSLSTELPSLDSLLKRKLLNSVLTSQEFINLIFLLQQMMFLIDKFCDYSMIKLLQ